MVQNEQYTTFDLKTLCFYMLRQWKPIVIVGLVMALLLGCLMAYSEHNTGLSQDMESNYWVEYQRYQEQKAYYEESIALAQSKLDSLEEYLNNSVLANIDHRNVYRTKAVYYIDTGYQVLPEYTYQNPDKTSILSWYYRRYLTNYSVYEEIGAVMGIDAKYLVELIDVSQPTESAVYITVRYSTEQGAMRITDMLQEKMNEAKVKLETTVEEHTLTLMEDSCGIYIDEGLKDSQKEMAEEVLQLKDSLIKYGEELIELKKEADPGELNVVIAFIEGLIAGGAIGAVLVMAYLLMKAFLGNRIIGASQLVSAYHASIFGEVISSKEKLPYIAKKINELEECLAENTEENLQFIAENIKNQCGNATNIMICSDVGANGARTFAEDINKHLSGIQLLPAGNVLKEASALRVLSKCDAVMLIVQRDQSKNGAIRKMLSQIRSYKKDVIGFIVSY